MPYKNRKEQLAAQRAHYYENKKEYRVRQLKVIARNREYVWNFLKNKFCIICGENDPIVLEFDHREQEAKICGISQAISNRKFSLSRLQIEMSKCDILCANCHRRKTAQQLKFKKINF